MPGPPGRSVGISNGLEFKVAAAHRTEDARIHRAALRGAVVGQRFGFKGVRVLWVGQGDQHAGGDYRADGGLGGGKPDAEGVIGQGGAGGVVGDAHHPGLENEGDSAPGFMRR